MLGFLGIGPHAHPAGLHSSRLAALLVHPGLQGTPWYLAPECCRAKWYPASDVWAVGVMACYLLAGKPRCRRLWDGPVPPAWALAGGAAHPGDAPHPACR